MYPEESYQSTVGVKKEMQLAREIYRAIVEELNAIAGYTYNSIILEPYLPAVAKVFEETSLTEMEHYAHLSELLRDMGIPPIISAHVKTGDYRLNEDADSHAIVIAKRMLSDSTRDEKAASRQYARLAASTQQEQIRKLLMQISEDETGHAARLKSTLQKLEKS